jgi:hypothetical protein
VTLFDTITGADSLATQTNYQGLALADTIELTDESIRRLLWEPIADTQNAGWTQIADTQSVTWVQIADTQDAQWSLINTE